MNNHPGFGEWRKYIYVVRNAWVYLSNINYANKKSWAKYDQGGTSYHELGFIKVDVPSPTFRYDDS